MATVKAKYIAPGDSDRPHGRWSKAERNNPARSSISDSTGKLILEGEVGMFRQSLLDKYPADFEVVKRKPGPKRKAKAKPKPKAPAAVTAETSE